MLFPPARIHLIDACRGEILVYCGLCKIARSCLLCGGFMEPFDRPVLRFGICGVRSGPGFRSMYVVVPGGFLVGVYREFIEIYGVGTL